MNPGVRAAAAWLAPAGAPAIFLPLLAAGIALCALAGEEVLWPARDEAAVEAPEPVGNALPARERARLRCDTCGVIEAIDRSGGSEGSPAVYAFAIRMRGGSMRRSTEAAPGSWQVGDRVLLIGSPSPASP